MSSVMFWVVLVALVFVVPALLTVVVVLTRRGGGRATDTTQAGPVVPRPVTEAEASELAERTAELTARQAELDAASAALTQRRDRVDTEHRELRSKADALMASAQRARSEADVLDACARARVTATDTPLSGRASSSQSRPSAATSPTTVIAGARMPAALASAASEPRVETTWRWPGSVPRSTIAAPDDAGRPPATSCG